MHSSSNASTRLTPAGLAAVIVSLLAVAAGMVFGHPHLLVAGVAGAAFLIAARFLAALHLSGLEVERVLPRRAIAGESFPMELRLKTGPRFPGDAVIVFTDSIAPSLKGKSIRPENGSLVLECTGTLHQRGLFSASSWSVTSDWPLGLFLSETRGLASQAHPLLVRPQPWLPPRLRRELDRRAAVNQVRRHEAADPLAEFRLLREFRAGDAIRSIHWPTSLRSGTIQVVENEPPAPKPQRHGLVLHSFEMPGEIVIPEHFEVILRIATGLLRRFRGEDAPVVFCQAPLPPRLLRERHDFDAALDQIALARRHPERSLDAIFDPVRAEAGLFSRCEDIFVIGDGGLHTWQSAARAVFPQAICLDALTVSLRRRALPRTSPTPR